MSSPSGAHRLELESQILCAALRQSWADTDPLGVVKVRDQLVQLYPDLAPEVSKSDTNFYLLFQIECDVKPSKVKAAYLKVIRKVLREPTTDIKARKAKLMRVINAGLILRNPRLRLSHDLIMSKVWVDEQKMFQPFSSVIDRGQPVAQSRPPLQAVHTTPAVEENVPMLVKLLRAAHKVGPAEEQALKNQLLLYPDVALADLVLRAGYVTEAELKSLQLAEYWLTPSK